MNIDIAIPIILAMFILNINPKVIDITLKSNCTGVLKPKLCPYDNHHSPPDLFATSPSNPPITNPDNINIVLMIIKLLRIILVTLLKFI